FYAKLAKAGYVEVHGRFDDGSFTMTATLAKIVDPHGGLGQVGAKGIVSDINATRKTFSIKPSTWEGFSGMEKLRLVVRAMPRTSYHIGDVSVTETGFFNALPQHDLVLVTGKMTGSGIKADTLTILN